MVDRKLDPSPSWNRRAEELDHSFSTIPRNYAPNALLSRSYNGRYEPYVFHLESHRGPLRSSAS